MSDDDVFHAEFDKHIRRNFARERAFLCPVHVFRADMNVRAFRHFDRCSEVGVRRADYDVGFRVFDQRNKFGHESLRLGDSIVHFPVTCDNRFTHNKFSFIKLSRCDFSLCR